MVVAPLVVLLAGEVPPQASRNGRNSFESRKVAGPWLVQTFMEYILQLYGSIPQLIG